MLFPPILMTNAEKSKYQILVYFRSSKWLKKKRKTYRFVSEKHPMLSVYTSIAKRTTNKFLIRSIATFSFQKLTIAKWTYLFRQVWWKKYALLYVTLYLFFHLFFLINRSNNRVITYYKINGHKKFHQNSLITCYNCSVWTYRKEKRQKEAALVYWYYNFFLLYDFLPFNAETVQKKWDAQCLSSSANLPWTFRRPSG